MKSLKAKQTRLAKLLEEAASLCQEVAPEECASPEAAYQHVIKAFPQLPGARKEMFVALFLDARRRVIGSELVSVGTLTATLVHPREVFAPALTAGACSILVAHNHPSGDPTPSHEDRLLTERLSQGARILGVTLDDHIVIGKGAFQSLRQMGILH